MTDPLTFIVTLVLRAAALIFLFRFMLQAVRASFYNPFSEGIVRITDPVLNPVRQVLKPYRNLDFASFALAWITHMLAALVFSLAAGAPLNLLYVLNDSLHATLESRHLDLPDRHFRLHHHELDCAGHGVFARHQPHSRRGRAAPGPGAAS